MIRRIDPDEVVTLDGVRVTGRQLAEARQELSHRGVHNPRWGELSQRDQDTAALSAGSWLRALAGLANLTAEAPPPPPAPAVGHGWWCPEDSGHCWCFGTPGGVGRG